MSNDRHKEFESTLSHALRAKLDRSGNDCPDSGILASYYERRLSAEEAARFELHASSCESCQAELAGIARTESAAPAAARKPSTAFDWFRDWRWTATAAAAATAVLALSVAIRLYPRVSALAPPSERARADKVAKLTAPAEMNDRTEQDLDRFKAAPEAAPQARNEKGEEGPKTLAERRGAPAAAAPAPPASPPALADRAPREEQPPVAAMRKAEPKAEGAFSRKRELEAQGAPTEERSQEAAPATRERDADTRRLEAAPPAREERLVVPQGSLNALRAGTAAPRNLAAAPGGSPLWRVGPQGAVERSRDGGTTWEKLPSPTTADLVAVEVRSDDAATVVTAGGKRFATADGGKTWRAE